MFEPDINRVGCFFEKNFLPIVSYKNIFSLVTDSKWYLEIQALPIDPTAVIDSTAMVDSGSVVGKNVVIGPYSIVRSGVTIGSGTRIDSHVVIESGTTIGENCVFFPFSSIGTVPQDLKFGGEQSQLIIGNSNTFREFCTVNRGTLKGGGATRVGDGNFFMAYVHIAHDCTLGNNIIMANAATLAGHISIEDHAIIGGLVAVHQFVRIGCHSMIGGCSAVAQDVLPYMSAVGNRAILHGLNTIGLRRSGFSNETIRSLKKVYKLLFRSGLTLEDAIRAIEKELSGEPIEHMINFIRAQNHEHKRGICRGES